MESYVFISIRLKFDLEFVHVLYLESTLPSDQFCSKEKFVKFYFGKMLSLFQVFHSFFSSYYSVGIYLFKVINEKTRAIREICSKVIILTLE